MFHCYLSTDSIGAKHYPMHWSRHFQLCPTFSPRRNWAWVLVSYQDFSHNGSCVWACRCGMRAIEQTWSSSNTVKSLLGSLTSGKFLFPWGYCVYFCGPRAQMTALVKVSPQTLIPGPSRMCQLCRAWFRKELWGACRTFLFCSPILS